MVALVVADTVLVVLLGLLVAGLLRSHADIARALHELGAPLGDPSRASAGRRSVAHEAPIELRRSEHGTLQMGPTVPPRAAGSAIFDLEGSSPTGDGLAIPISSTRRRTLLAFLSTGCTSCGQFWSAINEGSTPLPADVRTIIVTKGAESEQPAAVARLSARDGSVTVVMSTKAWTDYEVPGSPFFVLVDGTSDRRLGEGTARNLGEVAQLLAAAGEDAGHPPPGHRDHVPTVDEELEAAGIGPGDPSLFPRTIDDIVRRSDGDRSGSSR
jgi:hypothetical protein